MDVPLQTPERSTLFAAALNPTTTIRFALPEPTHVDLAIYDVQGRVVRTLADRTYSAGVHALLWDGTDNSGRSGGSGAYIYRLKAQQGAITKRMVLVR